MDTSRIISAKALGVAALATAAALSTALPTQAADDRSCQTAVARHLDGLDIDTNDVTDINMVSVFAVPEMGTIREHQAWASFQSCPGNLVVKLTTSCRVKEEYSRGGCRFDSVTQF